MGRRASSVSHSKASNKSFPNESFSGSNGKVSTTYPGYGWNSIFFHFSPATFTALVFFVVSVLIVRYLENLSWIDSIYAITGIMTTVGIVITPTTLTSRIFTAVLNIVSLGVAAAVIGEISENRKAYIRSLLQHQHKAPSLQMEATHTFIAAIVPLFVSSIGFVYLEDWSFDTSFYFAITNGTGLGMDGAIEPRTPMGRLIFSIYVIMELGVACSFLNIVGMYLSQSLKGWTQNTHENSGNSSGSGGVMSTPNNGGSTK